ncbi:MAG: mechanosensitive ion channel [Marinicaulis sp.]|nr:mechanosensitive ion channel [Marinicaulis sp.]NNE40345.1 mechanosensitive ion channel [Marinicaulis sp.]NNL88229.1 mechanosensitive ion channel [Marinicaulis sp.]
MDGFMDRIVFTWESYGPKVLAAILILLVTYLAAIAVRAILSAAIDRVPFVSGANKQNTGGQTIGAGFGAAGFWIIILTGLVLALERLGMTSVSNSVRGTVDQIFSYLPQIIGAVITFFVFMIVARVARQATTATLGAAQADKLPQKVGLAAGEVGVTSMLGAIVFALIAIPGGIAALQVLDIDAITEPAVAMLNDVMAAIPNIIVAVIVVTIFAAIAKFVTDLLRRLLPGSGLDNAVANLGLLQGADAGVSASGVLARIAGLIILLLGLIQATNTLGFEPLTDALDTVLTMGAQILFGSVIIFAGVLISGIVAKAMSASGSGATDFAAKIARYIIVILSVILGVSRMGLDPSGAFITQASLIILIGASLAGGIAFGLGGREWAGRQLERWNR